MCPPHVPAACARRLCPPHVPADGPGFWPGAACKGAVGASGLGYLLAAMMWRACT